MSKILQDSSSKSSSKKDKLFRVSTPKYIPAIPKMSKKKNLFSIRVQNYTSSQNSNYRPKVHFFSQKVSTVVNHVPKEVHMKMIQPEPPSPIKAIKRIRRRCKCKFSIMKHSLRAEKKNRKLKEGQQIRQRKSKPQTKENAQNASGDGAFEIGRWKVDEHQRFVDALINYGNDWKQVQQCVRTRSSTQARSHAQKFFIKILAVFLARVIPASTNAKPGCIQKTSIAAKRTQRVSIPFITLFKLEFKM